MMSSCRWRSSGEIASGIRSSANDEQQSLVNSSISIPCDFVWRACRRIS